MTYLSPHAQKARRNAAARDTLYNPTIARTSTKAIIMRPATAHKRTQGRVAWVIRDNLPDFHLNIKKDWWESDLANLRQAVDLFPRANLSAGAIEYLKETDHE